MTIQATKSQMEGKTTSLTMRYYTVFPTVSPPAIQS